MYFKRLEMHGFKSFAEPVVIEFHEGVTCIVGPNGSGKSNISDAIRWVLGEQSPKMLRGGKMEEVIFAGTASRKSRGMAEVTLVIDNSTGILPIDYNEVAITRRMYRSGESEYLINNNQCRLRDIRELIMDTGIGVDGYSLIGQGKIAEIVSNKPESRREIFEEAAGVVLYKSKKASAEKDLQSTEANLERVNDIVSEIEGRIDGLREDSIKAKEYLELKERYQELEINITLKNIEKLEEANDALKNDIAELTEAITEVNKSKVEKDSALHEAREKNEHLESLGNDARDKLLTKVEEINRLTNQSQLNEERIAGIQRDQERIEGELKELKEKLIRELENVAATEGEKEVVLKNLDEAETELKEKITVYNQAMSVANDYYNKVEQGKSRLFENRNLIAEKRSEARSIENLKENLEKQKQQIFKDQEELEKNSTAFEERMKQALIEKKESETLVETLRTSLKEASEDKKEYEEERFKLSRRNEELRMEGSRLHSRKKTIEEMEHNYEGYNTAVRFIMKNKKAGIRGVVADLMKVPAGYEVAIETALGGAMQNIVCEGDKDAKDAILALKEQKAGRCTFLPMGSIKGKKADVERKIEQVEGYLGLASDCIEYKKEYENIFHYLLGRVAIIEDMDHAIALSKMAGASGLRFVTLDGEIINTSGAITGGKYKNTTANLLERKQEVFRLEDQLKAIRTEMSAANERLEELNEILTDMEEVIRDTERDFHQAEIEISTLEIRIQTLEESGKDLASGKEKAERELEAIEKDFKNADAMIEGYLKEAEEKEKETATIEEEIEEALRNWDLSKEDVDKASEDITQTRILKNDWEGKRDSFDQLLARMKETTDDLQNQIDTRDASLEQLNQEKNRILYGSEDAEELVGEKEKEKANLEEYINQVREERAQLTQQIHTLEEEQKTATDRLNSYQDKKYQAEIKATKNDTQLETYKEKLWEEFEVSYLQAMEFKKNDFVLSTATKESRDIKNRMRQLGDVNVGSIKEYEEVNARYEFLTEQRADILTAMNELRRIITDMDKTIKEKFKENFDQIVINFEEIFRQLFGGGHAELRLDDENNPLEAGIEIIAQPPGKKLQNINLMSGGEKTMTAIALMFAVLKTKPTPFCILDEVEAALDDANIDRFANYLRKFDQIQFAIVTHQKATMEHADVLYGVTMPEQGISKILSLRLGDSFDL